MTKENTGKKIMLRENTVTKGSTVKSK
jgi:hypothetical protein